MAEIREGHDAPAPHAQHFAQHPPRLPRFLQGLAEDHVIEGVVGIVGQPLIDIALKHGDPARDRAAHFLARDLDAARIHVLVRGQPMQQFALATA